MIPLLTLILTIIAIITLLNALAFPRLKGANPIPALPRRQGRRIKWGLYYASLNRLDVYETHKGEFVVSAPPSLSKCSENAGGRLGGGVMPLVSVMIPARNEAAVIGETLSRLLAQDYPNFELLLLDDNSTDDTGHIARSFDDSRLTVLTGQPLPSGWTGKNWACHQMSTHARGDILLFTDADVRWQPQALTAIVHEMQRTNADLFTVWPTQETVTMAERLVVPMMALVVIGYLPILGVHYIPSAGFAAANGQCMAWRREAYQTVGGHKTVRDNVLEDVTLARIVKSRGLRLRMADGNSFLICRMYNGWSSVRDGYAKNIIAGYGGRVSFLILAAVFHWMIFWLPYLLLLTAPVWGLALLTLGIGVRLLTAAVTRQRLIDGWLMPVSVLLMTLIALRALYWHYHDGGPKWKGRTMYSSSARGSAG